VLGTAAIEQPELVSQVIERWGTEALCIALDARDGKVTTRGWQQATDVTPEALGNAMAARGVRHALFTDVSRDGGMQGVNLDSTIELGQATGLQVIASGGVSTLDEIRTLARRGVAGAVIGMALYEGHITLSEAFAAAKQES
jgi:phosphoribosylformimino-5-aminoimidazole carboxamide ribotide isomerase